MCDPQRGRSSTGRTGSPLMRTVSGGRSSTPIALVVLASVAATLGVVVSGAATASSNARASGIFSRETVGPATKITEVHVTPRLTTEGSGVKSVYVYGHMAVNPGEVAGGDIPCPRRTHPVSGLFSRNSPKVFELERSPHRLNRARKPPGHGRSSS